MGLAVTKWARWQECWAGFKQPSSCSRCTQSVVVLSPRVFPAPWLGSALTEPQEGTKDSFH